MAAATVDAAAPMTNYGCCSQIMSGDINKRVADFDRGPAECQTKRKTADSSQLMVLTFVGGIRPCRRAEAGLWQRW